MGYVNRLHGGGGGGGGGGGWTNHGKLYLNILLFLCVCLSATTKKEQADKHIRKETTKITKES
jgi:hypothetical protein